MNLLNDQREFKQQKSPAEEKVVPDVPEFEPVFAANEIPQQENNAVFEAEEPFVPYAGTHKSKSALVPKSSKAPIILLASAALIIAVLAYLWFFKGFGEKPTDPNLAANNTTEPILSSDSLVSLTPDPAQTQPTVSPLTDKSVELLGNIMSTIVESIPGSANLLTLFLDDGSFSIEVAGQNADLTKFQNDLKAGLPSSAKISSGSVTGGKTLVSGSFPRGQENSGGILIQKEQALTQLTSIANSAGAVVMETSAGKNVVSGSLSRAMIHFKVSGTVEQCQNVLAEFAQKGWNIQISKIILLPLNQQKANLVLRFLLANSA